MDKRAATALEMKRPQRTTFIEETPPVIKIRPIYTVGGAVKFRCLFNYSVKANNKRGDYLCT